MSSKNRTDLPLVFNRRNLDHIYSEFNRRALVHPDPLEFVYNYKSPRDREVAGLLASSLAYGRVSQILKSLKIVFDILGPEPGKFILEHSRLFFEHELYNFKHRFTGGHDLSALIAGMKSSIVKHGSLEKAFADFFSSSGGDIVQTIEAFVKEISSGFTETPNFLLPLPSKGSACKRLNLFLRWMIRSDEVDPGCWRSLPASALLVPLDTHMYQICFNAGFTKRKAADLKTVIEITEAFRKINPEDPVRYDFALTRFGIHPDFDMDDLERESAMIEN